MRKVGSNCPFWNPGNDEIFQIFLLGRHHATCVGTGFPESWGLFNSNTIPCVYYYDVLSWCRRLRSEILFWIQSLGRGCYGWVSRIRIGEQLLDILAGVVLPRLLWSGQLGSNGVLVMDYLASDLEDLYQEYRLLFTPVEVAGLAVDMVSTGSQLHQISWLICKSDHFLAIPA